jgi:hypothetical protein
VSTQHAVLLRLREKRSRATRVPSIGSGVGTHLAAPSASARLGAGIGEWSNGSDGAQASRERARTLRCKRRT